MAPDDLGYAPSALEAPRIVPRASRFAAAAANDGSLCVPEANVQVIQTDQATPHPEVAASDGCGSLQELRHQAHLEQQLLQSQLQQLQGPQGTEGSLGGLPLQQPLHPSQLSLFQPLRQSDVPNIWAPHAPLPESCHQSRFGQPLQDPLKAQPSPCVSYQMAPPSWCQHGNPAACSAKAPGAADWQMEPSTWIHGFNEVPSLLPPRGLDAPKLMLKPLVPPAQVSAPLHACGVESLRPPQAQTQGQQGWVLAQDPASASFDRFGPGPVPLEHPWSRGAGGTLDFGTDPGLNRLAGVSAKQDKEILATLHSSGFAVDLSADSRPDLSQVLDTMVATQGSAHSGFDAAMDRAAQPSEPRCGAQVTSDGASHASGLHSTSNPSRPSKPGPAGHAEVLRSGPMVAAEEFLRSYRPQMHLQSLMYPNGAKVDFTELAPVLRAVALANSQSAPRMLQAIESGSHVRTALQVFRECDAHGCGFLTWSNGGIRDFVMSVFIQLGLVPPAEMQTYAAHTLFDMNRTMCLSACDCLCLTDTLLRAIFLFNSEGEAESVAKAAAKARPSTSPPQRRLPRVVPVAEELAEAQAETDRLRRELEELRAAEAQADAIDTVDGIESEVLAHEPTVSAGTGGHAASETAALVWTARAHAENSRLEKELKSLRSLASRQRGEVQWLHDLRKQLKTTCRQEELEREHQQLVELQEDAAEAEQERELERRREQRLEALVQERQERRKRIEQRERELQEQELAHDLEQQRLLRKEQDLQLREKELQKERERRLQQAEVLRGQELDFSRELGRFKGSGGVLVEEMTSPPSASSDRLEPEEEADADSAEAAAQAAAQSLENRKLRRELESLRALAQWQQSEVGAVLACRSADEPIQPDDARRSSPGQVGSRPRGSLVMAALAGEALAQRADQSVEAGAPVSTLTCACGNTLAPDALFCHHCGRAASGQPREGLRSPGRLEPLAQEPTASRVRQQGLRSGIEEYDRTVRDLMSRVLGRPGDPGTCQTYAAAEKRVIEPLVS